MKPITQIDRINLENLNESANDLGKNYIYNLDSFIMSVASVLLIAVNMFWVFMEIFSRSSGFSMLGHIGVSIGLVIPSVTLIYLFKREESDYSAMRLMVVLFQIGTVASTLLLTYSSAGRSSSGGISLAMFWLIICAVVPMYSPIDSAIVMGYLLAATILPEAIAYRTISTSHTIVVLCIIAAYYGFRKFAISNSTLIQKLAFTSYMDHQTGTLNKRALLEYFPELVAKNTNGFGIIVYDIDDLRAYNYKYTHTEGDKTLVEINDSALKVLKDEGALVFRQGGAEFVAVIDGITEDRLLKVALKLKSTVESLKIPRDDGSMRPFVTVTVGCAHTGKNFDPSRDILSEAGTQLFIGKKGSKNCVVYNGRIYLAEGEVSVDQQPSMYTERVAQAISEAMRRNEMKIYFQPLYDTTTQNMVGAEALSRWVKPDGTIILPAEYIPELEKNSSILALDWFMFEETCRVLKKMKDMGLPTVRVSVNFSRMHVLYERDIEHRLSEIADSYSISHSLIEIEITESAYIYFPSIMEPMIRAIRMAGFAVAVDDFGSGSASLEFINSVDVDTLKIDKSLISSNCPDEKERVLLESVVLLAHRLQLNSVAEGVETMEQLGFLKTIGCKQIQGFIFSKPLTEEEYIDVWRKESKAKRMDVQIPDSPSNQSSMQMLLDTVFKEYPTVIISNLSRDSYYTMTYENFTDHKYPQAGVVSALIDEICSTIVKEDRDEFRRVFSKKRQFDAFEKGEAKFTYTARLISDSDKSDIKTVHTLTYYIKEVGNDDLLAVTMCSESGLG